MPGAPVTLDHGRDDLVGIVPCQRCVPRVAREIEELANDAIHLLDVVDHALACPLVARLYLDAQAQPRQRRAQIMRDAGQEQGAVLLDLPQVGQHPIESRD